LTLYIKLAIIVSLKTLLIIMRYSKLFGKTSKTIPANAESANERLLTQAGFVVKQMAGVYNYLSLGLRVLAKIQNIIREEMNAIGGNEILMPALTQEENYAATGRNTLDILFHLKGRDDSELVLNQSHEEVVVPLTQKYVFSYRDLPVAVYQIQNKFRNEPRAKSGLLRGREFNMKDMYSFHADEADLDAFYEKTTGAYFKIYNRLGLREKTVLTFASGGTFSKYSHEFQTLCDIGEDTIYLCKECHMAVNKEIIHEQNACPQCGSMDLSERKSIEVGNIFKLKTRYTDAFSFVYTDAEGKHQPVTMGCYGIGPSRVMGTLVEVFHDDKGIIWPEVVAPYKVHLVSFGKDAEVIEAADKFYKELQGRGVEALYDDRVNVSAGEKLADADLIGIPNRVVISKRTLEKKSVEMKKRNETEAKLTGVEEAAGSM